MVLIIMLYKVTLMFESVDEIQYFPVVLFIMHADQGGSNFSVCE